jgi:outer membrane receptor protein involved in Fe transport
MVKVVLRHKLSTMYAKQLLKTVLTLLISVSFTGVFAQTGTITGKVFDKNNAPVTGASIKVTGSTRGANTDIEGRFSIGIAAGTYVLEISALNFKTGKETVVVKIGAIVDVQIMLQANVKEIEAVTVTSSGRRKETTAAMILFQKNTNTIAQVISAEAIKKSPDRTTSEVLKRIPGASIQEGKYLVVRGLADRYNQATLNGALLSSSEPDRKTFSFDIFPASIVDNIIINKAAVPELPGEFAGGLIQVNTRDVPVKNFFQVQIGTGFNFQTIGNDFYDYKGGKTDWLGVDDGTRALPADYPTLRSKFENLSSADQLALARKMTNIWALDKRNAPLNLNFQLSGGINSKLKKGRLGAIFAINYSNVNRRIETQRNDYFLDGTPTYAFTDIKYKTDILAGALANITYQVGKTKLSWKNTFNISAENYATSRTGVNFVGPFDIKAYELAFISNTLYSSQLTGEHLISQLSDLRIKWQGNYSYLNQQTPDLRRLSYVSLQGANDFQANIPQGSSSITSAGRFYSDLTDNVGGGGIDFIKNFNLFGDRQVVKAGYLFQGKHRSFNPRSIGYAIFDNSAPNAAIKRLSPAQLFDVANIDNNKIYLNEVTNPQDRYYGTSLLNAGYLQFDNNFSNKIKASWGVRYENFYQQIRFRRQEGAPRVKSTTKTGDFLPSANINYSLNGKTNLRLSASQTVIRAEFRELAEFRFYNFDLLVTEGGNPNLKRTKVTNLDLRYEVYPTANEFFTIGAFYKRFNNPIEKYYNSTGGGTAALLYGNASSANGAGAELEFRKSLGFLNGNKEGFISNFTVFGNASYIFNRVQFNAGSNLKDRPMQGQSNYVVNGGVQYDHSASGTNFSILFNKVGQRIFLVGDEASVYNMWEKPRTILDFQVTKAVLKARGELKLSISDLLNQFDIYYEDRNSNRKQDAGDVERFRNRFGSNLSISFLYKFK